MMAKSKETQPDGLNLLASLIVRVTTLENRLDNINIPPETVQAISVQTLRMLGQLLIQVTAPQARDAAEPESETQEETAQEAAS